MAGNIVKWWKHKILGGYKQFSVLQECTTDSEELMYPVRAPSSCSAPPDLLLVSDRENVQIKTPVNIISTSKVQHNQHHQKQHQSQHHHHQQQQQLQHQQHHHHQQQKDVQMMKQSGHNNNNNNNNHKNTEATTAATNHRVEGPHQKSDDQRMHLEEFTCDVSVEGGKSSQPLQFSFTFYDLDGHHGKITKDDIVGIVYTIYESIGKSVVVPHCGSKTINVRLTVSPEGKSKSAEKLKKSHSSAPGSQQQQQPPYQQQQQQQQQHSRRQHRYRPRKLIKSDDEEDDADSGSEKEISNNKKTPTASSATTTSKFNKLNVEGGGSNQKFCCPDIRVSSGQDQSPHLASRLMDNSQHSGQSTSQQTNSQPTNNTKYPTATENIYESMANLKCCPKESRKVELDGCKECAQSSFITSHQQYLKQASTRAKILRKARKQKYQEQCYESRQRSLSVGNESCWKFRSDRTGQDDVDGRAVPSSAECWNNALKRNDLIDIIRESMEKNRLCFQSNGKTQPNVSPIRHRQRSNTVSKMHDENYQQQTSHHIPIYHQQMAINPAILSQNNGILHPKTNLCGYDSFLHATICSSINNTSTTQQQQQQHQQQQSLVPNQKNLNSPKIYVNNNNSNLGGKNNKILNKNIGYHSQQHSPQFHGYQRLSSSHSGGDAAGIVGATKLNTSLLNSLNPQLSAEEKLHRTIDHVEKWLTERDQGMLKVNDLKALKYSIDEHKCKKDVKNYDNFLYAKLTEKLQEIPRKGNNQDNCLINDNSNNNSNNNNNNNNKENIRRSHHSHNYYQKLHRRHTGLSPSSSAPAGSLHKGPTSGNVNTTSNNKFTNLIPVDIVDPIECENLLHPTSDEDTVPQTPTPSTGDVPPTNTAGNSNNGNNSTTSSSMIHRYVHEHIHHHYHHFENKDD